MINQLIQFCSYLGGGFNGDYSLWALHHESIVIGNFWLWQFFGRLHPMIVHFPIGLLVVVLVLEVFSLRRSNNELRPAINVLLVIGALSAVLAVAFLTLPGFPDIIARSNDTVIGWTYLMGLLWGIGGLTYGLGIRYLGMSLGNSVILGYCAAFGSLIPPIFYNYYPQEGKISFSDMMDICPFAV